VYTDLRHQPAKGVSSGGGVISGALHRFVLSAVFELKPHLRVKAVSPTMVEDSVETFGEHFKGWPVVRMDALIEAYVSCIQGEQTGQIVRA
jgi:hypothetical protein